jgi:hypothetical protein
VRKNRDELELRERKNGYELELRDEYIRNTLVPVGVSN